MDRRDFMKYFGIGSTIVPLVAGMPKMDAGATLIEVPKAEIEVAQTIPSAFPVHQFINRSKLRMQVNFLDEKGNLFSFEADTFLTSIERIEITFRDDQYRRYIPGQMKWDMSGVVVSESSNIQRAHDQRNQATLTR
jgi:hypothetical protein